MSGSDHGQPPSNDAATDPAQLSRNLAWNFRRRRKELGESQMQLAQRTGLSQKYISEIEVGRGNPTIHTLEHLAMCLSVTVADLIAPQVTTP